MVSLVPVLDMGEGNYVPVGKDPVVSGDFAVTLRSNKVRNGMSNHDKHCYFFLPNRTYKLAFLLAFIGILSQYM